MAEQGKMAQLQELRLRQEALLNNLSALQYRANQLQPDEVVTYDTSTLNPAQFKQLASKQSTIFQRLLGIASQIDSIAQKQSLQLPATQDVGSIIHAMANSLEKRQKRTLSQLQTLSDIADSIQSPPIGSNIRSFIDEAKPAPKPTTAEPAPMNFDSRLYDLEMVSECLRPLCARMDTADTGRLRKAQMCSVLDKCSLVDIAGSVGDETHIAALLEAVSTDATRVDYNQLLDLVMDCAATETSPLCAQWNRFRHNLVGAGRVEGALRILYRYDGWPEPLTIVAKGVETEGRNKVALHKVLRMIADSTGEDVEYQELRCAVKLRVYMSVCGISLHKCVCVCLSPTFVPGRRGWEVLDTKDVESERVALLVSNDGMLEVDVWLRTQGFIDTRTGQPLPKANEDLVDVD